MPRPVMKYQMLWRCEAEIAGSRGVLATSSERPQAVALGFDRIQRPGRADRQLLGLLRLSFESLPLPTQIG
jgi:hypothetical protein